MQGKILAVDDDIVSLEILKEVLTDAGYQVTIADDGRQAFELASRLLPDLILLDIVMPGINGYEVCRGLKKTDRLAHIPVLFLSGLSKYEDIVEGFEAGGIDYVSKPFNRQELLARIKTHLQLVRLRLELEEQNATNVNLLRVLTHDLSNQLQAITSFSDLGVLSTREPDGHDLFYCIRSRAASASELIGCIRELIAIETGKVELVPQPVALQNIIASARATFEHRLRDKQIRLVSVPDEVPANVAVLAEPVSFQNSVVNNLISNAIKFSYPGSQIEVAVDTFPETVQLTVGDSGTGIAASILDIIFSTDKKTSIPGTCGERGTGFGMPLVRRYVERYRGTLEIRTRHEDTHPDNHGTEITLTLLRSRA